MLLIIKHKKCVIKSSDIGIKTKIGHNAVVMKGSCIDSLSEIGSYCYIGKYCYITKTTIGNYCSIANNVSIGQGEHDLDQISTNSIFYHDPLNELTKKDCKIGNDVWIGVDSIVKRGVEIGDGAVIGANSVVTKDIPPYAIAVGNPAKVIRYRFDGQTIQNIQKSQWWNCCPQEAKKIFAELKK